MAARVPCRLLGLGLVSAKWQGRSVFLVAPLFYGQRPVLGINGKSMANARKLAPDKILNGHMVRMYGRRVMAKPAEQGTSTLL